MPSETCPTCGATPNHWPAVFRNEGRFVYCPECGSVKMLKWAVDEQNKLRAERLAKQGKE
jgi:uncharacterized Zn finger protein (UPF0148 family)